MKIFQSHLLFLWLILFSVSCSSGDKSIEGLWLMSHVSVGDQEMTPVAKWTRINDDGTYESGNGWLKSSHGTWTYNDSERTFLPSETNGLLDPYGAFEVSLLSGETTKEMIWSREEEGILVEVTLTPIDELPKAPADRIQGLWDLAEVQENNEIVTDQIDPENNRYIFIRWDRIYVERTSEGERQTGYWHMNGHSSEVTLLSHNSDESPQTWRVSFTDDQTLLMSGISDSNRNMKITFTRLDQFPS